MAFDYNSASKSPWWTLLLTEQIIDVSSKSFMCRSLSNIFIKGMCSRFARFDFPGLFSLQNTKFALTSFSYQYQDTYFLHVSMLLYQDLWIHHNWFETLHFLKKTFYVFKNLLIQSIHNTVFPYCSFWHIKICSRQILNVKVSMSSSCEKWINFFLPLV